MSEVIVVNAVSPESHLLERAVRALRRGDLVAYPTDTLYGLAADPSNHGAIARLFQAKGRPVGRAIALIAADLAQVDAITGGLTGTARRLAERWWPGPLTLVVRSTRKLAPGVCGAGASIAIRIPAHAIARALADRLGEAITSTSANRTDAPAPSSAPDLSALVVAEVAVVVDGGPTAGGPASTIVDLTGPRPALRRAGPVSWSRVLESLE